MDRNITPSSLYFEGYPKDSVVFEGTMLQPGFYENSLGQIVIAPLAFGYADNLPTNNYGDFSVPDNPYTQEVVEGGGGQCH